MERQSPRCVRVFITLVSAIIAGTALADDGPSPADSPKQEQPPDARSHAEGEMSSDKPIVVDPKQRRTSPAVRAERGNYVSVQVNVDADGNNILGDAGNEPSLAVDPNNSDSIVIGWRQFDTVESNFRQAGWGYTTNGGQNWTFPGVIEPGIFRSDPVLDSDGNGVFHYNSLTLQGSDFWCTVFRSYDGGVSWDAGEYAEGGDKQWMVIDKTNGSSDGNIYSNWTRFYSICDGQLTRSYDGGDSYFPCIEVDGQPQWGTMAVGPDGEMYIVGTGSFESLIVVKSSDIQNPLDPPTFDFVVEVPIGGWIEFGEGPNPGGLLGQAWIAVDQSDGPTRGWVYVAASVNPPGPDPLNLMFARSTDGGLTWSAPVRINDDSAGSNAWQWFGTMSVAPNGRIDIIWNDTRNDPGGFDSELHYSFSEDNGVTWSPNEAVSPAFDPHLGWPDQSKIGDYYDMISEDWGAHVAYSATFNGEQDVYYLRIGSPCAADVNDDAVVDVLDLLAVLAAWGETGGPADVNDDGVVDILDLLAVLAAWGPC